MPSQYVLVWREPPATRLRTYVSASGHPLASPLSNVFPHPAKIINTGDELSVWLNADADTQVVAIRDTVAREELGWEPETSTMMTKDTYTDEHPTSTK